MVSMFGVQDSTKQILGVESNHTSMSNINAKHAEQNHFVIFERRKDLKSLFFNKCLATVKWLSYRQRIEP